MATLAGDALLIGISTPYRKSALLYRKFRDHFSKGGDVLVIKAPSTTPNRSIIDDAMGDDPAAASAEWLAEFRDDIGGWVGRELIEGAVDHGVQSRAPQPGISYHTFCDPLGGASNSSFTAAVTHSDNGTAVLDCLVEIKAPFNPDRATADVAQVLKSYDVYKTTGDRYAAQWVVAAFTRHDIALTHSERDRSLTTGRVRLVDNKRLARCFGRMRTTQDGPPEMPLWFQQYNSMIEGRLGAIEAAGMHAGFSCFTGAKERGRH
jgi:hypothetical protein